MGILGLTSFLNNSILDDVLLDIELKNCQLLIDGYSFLHKIHSVFKLNSTYGGNYDELALRLDEVFGLFKTCNIEPIFLLDGARDAQEQKLKTTLNRANQRLHDASILNNCVDEQAKNSKKKLKVNLESLLNSGNYRIFNNLLPIMAFKIFLDSLTKFGYIHFQCPFEADYELVCLANLLEVPLLSCDSDFYVYDLKHGYVSLNDVEFEAKTSDDDTGKEGEHFLSAKIYKLDEFLSYQNKNNEKETLKKEMLPIFSVICGNDYVDKLTFESLWKTFDASNNNLKGKKKFSRLSNTKTKTKSKDTAYKKLLKWLSQFRNVNECVTTILNFVKVEKHKTIERVIRDSIQDYMCLKPSLARFYRKLIMEKLNKSNIYTDDLAIETLTVNNFDQSQISDHFMKMYRECQVSRYCLDVLLHRKIILSCQIEVSEWPSSYVSSTRIRKLLYTVLIKMYGMGASSEMTEEATLAEKNVLVKEFLRYQKQIKTFDLDLGDLNKVNLSEFFDSSRVYKNLFNFDDNLSRKISLNFSALSARLKNFFATIYYWLNSDDSSQSGEFELIKNENCVRAFLVALIKICLIDKCFFKLKNLPTFPSFSQNPASICQYEQNYEKDTLLSRHFSPREDEASNEFLNSLSDDLVKNESDHQYLSQIRVKLNSFSYSIVINNNFSGSKINRLLNLKLVHCLCEFQSICYSLNYMEEVIKLSQESFFKLLTMQSFFNGAFLHNFIEELEQRSDPDLYIEELFGRKSFFKFLYRELLDKFKSTFEINAIAKQNVSLSKSQKKRLKKKEQQNQISSDVEMGAS
jgi:hypothetical protein